MAYCEHDCAYNGAMGEEDSLVCICGIVLECVSELGCYQIMIWYKQVYTLTYMRYIVPMCLPSRTEFACSVAGDVAILEPNGASLTTDTHEASFRRHGE